MPPNAESSCSPFSKSVETKYVSTDFEKGEQLLSAFGGIAGILRYATGV